jgi:hypothetical protein
MYYLYLAAVVFSNRSDLELGLGTGAVTLFGKWLRCKKG